MSQVGRISGPLLFANLERNGIDLAFETDLLYLDVNNGKIGIRNNAPTNDLHVLDTTRTTTLYGDTQADIANINFQNSTIQPFPGQLFLDARYKITSSNAKTGDIFIDDNYISTTNSNSNLELRPNGTGRVEVYSDLHTDGNIHATGNITLDGNIIFGDTGDDSTALNDTVTFQTDVNSNIDPTVTEVYDLGKYNKRWLELNTRLVNGVAVESSSFILGGVDLNNRPGKTYYVSKNGDNDYTGTHVQHPFETIDYAVTQATAGDTIHVFPGEYEESTPIVVPAGVTVVGHDLRNTVITPPSSQSSTDIFHLNGESTVANFTIKDFFYDSVNDTGYAFRFAPNATITTRSPYVQNVTVSTQGSTTSASDPRGYASGDAGKGALVDGASVLGTSNEASMLFHAVTFITPGVDALTMTNGVRVEWLNSFTYFADRGLYAVNGATGHLSTDGSTIKYGAELRSIGSANVYGNKGAEADGADTLMYLIQHNFGYIGSGKFVDNDPSRVIQTNETIELNSGKIYYSSTDHLGNFRVGDQFFVDLETGNSTLTIDESTVNALAGLTVTTNGNIAIIDGNKVQNQNIRFSGNTIESLSGEINIDSPASTFINLNGNTNLVGNLDITDNFTFDGTLSLAGDQPTDTVTFNTEFSQDLEPNQDLTFTLGNETKRWNWTYVNDAEIDGVTIETNYITSNESNADLELRASGTGKVNITDQVNINNQLTALGTSTFQNVSLQVLTSNADLEATNFSINDFNIQGNLDIQGEAQLENILIDDNFITTTQSNSDLELRAAGTGEVTTQELVRVNGLLINESTLQTGNVDIAGTVTFGTLETDEIRINNNTIEAFNTNQDLNLDANGTGEVQINSSDVIIQEDLTVNGNTTLQGTDITGSLVHSGNLTQTGNYNIAGEISNGNILIEDNFITTTNSNSDLELRASGTGEVLIPNNDVQVNNNFTVTGASDFQDVTVNGTFLPGFSYQTGDRSFNGNLTISQNLDVTGFAQFEEILVDDNFITTTTSNTDLELRASGTGKVLIPNNNVVINNNLTVNDANVVNVTVAQDILLNEIVIPPSIIEIDDNFISTKVSNESLDLRANGSGNILYVDNTTISNNLNVNGQTNTENIEITGTTNIVGNTNFAQDYNLTGQLTTDKLVLTENYQDFERVGIHGNKITSQETNTDLELRASGTGRVVIDNATFDRNVTVNDLNANNIIADQSFEAALIDSENIEAFGNVVTTTLSNSDLELRANGTGQVIVDNASLNISNNFTVNDQTVINDDTTVTGSLNINGDTVRTGNSTVTLTSDYTINGALTVDRKTDLGDWTIDGNVLEYTQTGDVVLDTAGTGDVVFTDTVVSRDMSAASASFGSLRILDSVALENMVSSTDIEIFDNVITTTNSNSNLELRAAGNVEIDNNFSVTGTSQIDGTTSLQGTEINAPITVNANIIQTGNRDITGDYSATNLIVDRRTDLGNFTFEDSTILNNNIGDMTITGSGTGNVVIEQGRADKNLTATSATSNGFFIEKAVAANKFIVTDDIEIFQNVITTTNSNSNLELRTSGSGEIYLEGIRALDSTLQTFSGNDLTITSNEILFDSTHSIQIPIGDSSQRIVASVATIVLDGGNGVNDPQPITVDGGDAVTVFGPTDTFYDGGTSLEPNGNAGDIRFNTDYGLFEGFSQANQYFGGVFSEDAQTNVQALNDEVEFRVAGTKVGSVAYDGVNISTSLKTANITISNNIVTSENNTALQLVPNGAGTVKMFDNMSFDDNKIKNLANDDGLHIVTTDNGYVKIDTQVSGIVLPTGDNSTRDATPVVGEIRYNTEAPGAEIWNGTEWVSVAGDTGDADAIVLGEAFDEWTLILG